MESYVSNKCQFRCKWLDVHSIINYTYRELKPQSRILKVDQNGAVAVFEDRLLSEPVNDVEFNQNNGLLYLSHGGKVFVASTDKRYVKCKKERFEPAPKPAS